MLVDDSAIVRGLIARSLEDDPEIEIAASVPNGQIAVNSIVRHSPDIVVLDIEMPVMDGLTTLPLLLEKKPDVKVVMCSTLTEKGAKVTMQALALGAVECIAKPSSTRDAGSGSDFQSQLLHIVKSLGPDHDIRKARVPAAKKEAGAVTSAPAVIEKKSTPYTLRNDPLAWSGRPGIIAIGSSTGGPQALFEVMKNCKDLDVPIIITQHMPPTFTRILAEHIEHQAGVPCHEGTEGMKLESGHAYIAPGGFHMEVVNDNGLTKIHVVDGPAENFCKPSVDPMVRSAIKVYGKRILGVILTGMGSDGLKGMEALVEAGGRLVAQDEKSSVVWGMPGAVATAGLCTEVLPLDRIGPWIRDCVNPR